tara:strand:+ start:1179 stop:1814 length:636 start_codon:yes stop_codon:yes gene_type:complete
MTKEENQNLDNNVSKKKGDESDQTNENIQNVENEKKEEQIEKSSEEKLFEIEDKLTRTLAEMENQRRRFEKEKQEAFEYGGFAFAKEALNLIDNLERSKQILENDETIKNSEALKKTLEHLKIINQDLISIFSKNNINPIDSLNKKLDPNYHQAMMEIEDDKKEPGTIVQEIQKGFTIGDRLLRPSLVGVSKKSADKDQKAEENKENTNQK